MRRTRTKTLTVCVALGLLAAGACRAPNQAPPPVVSHEIAAVDPAYAELEARLEALAAQDMASWTRGNMFVEASRYGDRWPFTVQSGILRCTRGEGVLASRLFVTFEGGGIRYGLNGAARGVGGFEDGQRIQKSGTHGVDRQAFIDLGLTLCGS